MQIHLFLKNFHAWNILLLAVASLFLRWNGPSVPVLQWPLGNSLSILVLSSLAFYLRERMIGPVRLIIIGMFFSISHWMLAGFFEVLLTRFFRLDESYNFREFGHYLKDHLTLLPEGMLWFGVYMLLFSWIRAHVKLASLTEINQELERELGKVDLRALNQEMSPHFLFNAMNGIAMKVRMKDSTKAVNMIAALTDLLRLSLSKQHTQQVTLEEEIALLNKYLLIEQTRFGDHFSIAIDFPDAMMKWKVPRLILQPLVENAFKHGMHHQMEEMVVRVEGKEVNDHLVLSVYNSRIDHSVINFVSSNIGLPNIVHRLRRFYGTDFQFKSHSARYGVVFSITIPQHL